MRVVQSDPKAACFVSEFPTMTWEHVEHVLDMAKGIAPRCGELAAG